jgi:uncharacterized protein (DUF433 family)
MTELLDRAVYDFRHVDRLLTLPAGTARRWIDGYERGGRSYGPIVRAEPTGEDAVTWGEFVETAFLAEYREADVPLQRIRPVVDGLRERLGVAHPLAYRQPLVSGRELVETLQTEGRVPEELLVVRRLRDGQLALTTRAETFEAKIEYGPGDHGVAVRLKPLGAASPVRIDPDYAFGDPTVRGVRTSVLAEDRVAGASVQELASAFDLTPDSVREALRYEGCLEPVEA